MKPDRRTQADRSAATRAALIRAGRELFAAQGFARVGTEAIVAAASVSRGALYHQFGDKTELFAAVLAEVEREVTAELMTAVAARAGDDFVSVMTSSFEAWLDACRRADVQQILLVDGPSVLGWRRWRDICQEHVLGLIENVLTQGMAEDAVAQLPAKPLAHLLLAMGDEAALYLSTAEDPRTARREIALVVRPLIESISTQPPRPKAET